jgi:diguanylate cyclase (GGDEF)-like protein
MDRGGTVTFGAALVPAAAAAAAVVLGVPEPAAGAVTILPELLAALVALLSVRFGCHRAMVATALVVALHQVDVPAGPAAILLAFHVVILGLVPDGRLTRVPALIHLVVAAASLPALATWWPLAAELPWAARATDPLWAAVGLAIAAATGIVVAVWRRRPFEVTLPWLTGAFAFVCIVQPGETTRSLTLAAVQAILVIALVEEGRRLAFHDGLTGLANRRAFDEQLLRMRGRYAVAMVDVDHFKAFNDRWGHDNGDQALRMVASEVARVGMGGTAYRYGGEEFAILFPSRAHANVVETLEVVRTAIADRGFIVRSAARPRRRPRKSKLAGDGDRRVRLTVSIGVASPDTRRTDAVAVLRAADRALYRAKRTGRNRVAST